MMDGCERRLDTVPATSIGKTDRRRCTMPERVPDDHSITLARVRRHETIASLSQQALANSELDPLMEATVAHVASLLDVDVCVIVELLPDGSTLRRRASAGPFALDTSFAISNAGPQLP